MHRRVRFQVAAASSRAPYRYFLRSFSSLKMMDLSASYSLITASRTRVSSCATCGDGFPGSEFNSRLSRSWIEYTRSSRCQHRRTGLHRYPMRPYPRYPLQPGNEAQRSAYQDHGATELLLDSAIYSNARRRGGSGTVRESGQQPWEEAIAKASRSSGASRAPRPATRQRTSVLADGCGKRSCRARRRIAGDHCARRSIST